MNFTIDRTAPTVEISNFTAFKIGNNTPAMTFNYSDNLMVSADCRLILNESLAGAVVVAQNNATTNATNTTLQVNHTLGDGEYEMTVNCTDFAGNEANSTTKVNITVDTAAPGVSVTKSSSDSSSLTLAVATAADSRKCSTDRNGATVTSTGASQTITESGLAPSTSYTYKVTCVDDVDNSNSASFSFTTGSSSGAAGGSGGGGSSSSSASGEFVRSAWTELTPEGETASISVENEAVGTSKIEFGVTEPVTGVWLNVRKVINLPEGVPNLVQKTFKYFEVRHHPDLTSEKIKDAKIFFKVTKNWLEDEGLTKNNVALYRYTEGIWQELTTRITNEEDRLIHFEADIDGFSFFAVGQSAAERAAPEPATVEPTEPVEEVVTPPAQAPEKKSTPIWVWIVVLVVIGAVIFYFVRKRK
tara:strand:- start:1193 stop:2440 length:1248 start_codon:yes stop_codon:yes gene_type:complete